MTVVLPPVEANCFRFVDGADHEPDPDRQELDFSERDLDVSGDHQSLVEDPIEDVYKPGVCASMTSCEVRRHVEGVWLSSWAHASTGNRTEAHADGGSIHPHTFMPRAGLGLNESDGDAMFF